MYKKQTRVALKSFISIMRWLARNRSAIRAESQSSDLLPLIILPIGELYAERLHSPINRNGHEE